MALSWSELSIDHKIVFLLESLVNEQVQHQQVPIACRLCDEIFFDNKSLINHFQSHFNRDGTNFNRRPLVGSFVSPGNGTNFISRSSQYTHSLSVPVNVHNSIAHQNLGPCARQNVSPDLPNPSLGNSLVPTLSQNSVQLRGATLADRPQSYSSAINHGIFAPQPSQPSSNFHSRFASQPTGPQNFHSTIRPIGPGIFTSETIEQSNFNFPTNPGTSTSQPIKQSNFCSPITVGAFSLQSIPGTSGLALGTTRCLPQTGGTNEVDGPFSGYTKPYIKQLEQPVQETIAVNNDVGGNNNPDDMDLTLKL